MVRLYHKDFSRENDPLKRAKILTYMKFCFIIVVNNKITMVEGSNFANSRIGIGRLFGYDKRKKAEAGEQPDDKAEIAQEGTEGAETTPHPEQTEAHETTKVAVRTALSKGPSAAEFLENAELAKRVETLALKMGADMGTIKSLATVVPLGIREDNPWPLYDHLSSTGTYDPNVVITLMLMTASNKGLDAARTTGEIERYLADPNVQSHLLPSSLDIMWKMARGSIDPENTAPLNDATSQELAYQKSQTAIQLRGQNRALADSVIKEFKDSLGPQTREENGVVFAQGINGATLIACAQKKAGVIDNGDGSYTVSSAAIRAYSDGEREGVKYTFVGGNRGLSLEYSEPGVAQTQFAPHQIKDDEQGRRTITISGPNAKKVATMIAIDNMSDTYREHADINGLAITCHGLDVHRSGRYTLYIGDDYQVATETVSPLVAKQVFDFAVRSAQKNRGNENIVGEETDRYLSTLLPRD